MSEHGFYHPDRGYWQTVDDVTDEILSAYPEGTVEVPLRPDGAYKLSGTEWVSVDPTVANLKAYTAAKRYAVETGGIVVNGAKIDTSIDSQNRITSAYVVAQASPEGTIKFKATSGWVTLTSAEMITIGAAVGAFVQAMFAAEDEVDAAIDAGTVTTTAEIDAWTWPAST